MLCGISRVILLAGGAQLARGRRITLNVHLSQTPNSPIPGLPDIVGESAL
jgi:hypothetical protein